MRLRRAQMKDLLLSFVVARRHDLPDLAHPRNRRAAVDAHRRHRARQDGRAGRIDELRPGGGSGESLEELFIELVGGDARPHAELDWI